jgi:hypothetical protein
VTSSPSISNAYGIICDALTDAGKLRSGSDPDGETIALNMRRLNKLINYYMTQGLKLFLLQDTAVTLVPPVSPTQGVALYTFGPSGTVVMQKPLRVISGYYLDIYGNQRPLIALSYPNEYLNLSNLLQPGAINSYAVNKQAATLNVYLWNAPDQFTCTNGNVHFVFELSVTNFTGVTDQMAFPLEWSLALEWGLAELCSIGQPASVIARCAAMAEKYRMELENWDVEDADTEFQIDQRSNQYRGRFR